MASPPPRRSQRLRSLSPEVSRSLPLRRRLNGTDPHGLRSFESTITYIEAVNNNHFEEPQVSDNTSKRDNLEHQSIGSLIGEAFPPMSQVIPYPVDIEETQIQVQLPLRSPLVRLPYLDFNNFRDFDQNIRTVRKFPLD